MTVSLHIYHGLRDALSVHRFSDHPDTNNLQIHQLQITYIHASISFSILTKCLMATETNLGLRGRGDFRGMINKLELSVSAGDQLRI